MSTYTEASLSSLNDVLNRNSGPKLKFSYNRSRPSQGNIFTYLLYILMIYVHIVVH